jgi:hypothetical protein
MKSVKRLEIFREQLSLGKGQLRKNILTVGRSPSCDIVLRAQGVAPIHFLIEWLGEGEFNPEKGDWTILDITVSSQEGDSAHGRGAILHEGRADVGGFTFVIQTSRLEVEEVIGGNIRTSVNQKTEIAKIDRSPLLEVVWAQSDTHAINEVAHLKKRFYSVRQHSIQKQRLLPIHWGQGSITVDLGQVHGAELRVQGKVRPYQTSIEIRPGEVTQIHWKNQEFYFRQVDAIPIEKIPHDFFRDPILRNSFFISLLVFLISGSAFYWGGWKNAEEEIPPPPRVARIEVKEEVPPPPPPPPTPTATAPASSAAPAPTSRPSPPSLHPTPPLPVLIRLNAALTLATNSRGLNGLVT